MISGRSSKRREERSQLERDKEQQSTRQRRGERSVRRKANAKASGNQEDSRLHSRRAGEQQRTEYERQQLELQREMMRQEDIVREEDEQREDALRRRQIEDLEDEREAVKLQLQQQQLEYERARSHQQVVLQRRLEEQEQARKETQQARRRKEMEDQEQMKHLEEELEALRLHVEHQRLAFENQLLGLESDFLQQEVAMKDAKHFEDVENAQVASKMNEKKQYLELKVLELEHAHDRQKARREDALEEKEKGDQLRDLEEQGRRHEIEELERRLQEQRLQHEHQQLELMEALDRQEIANSSLGTFRERALEKARQEEKMELQEKLRQRRLEYENQERALREKLEWQREEQQILEKEEMLKRDNARRDEMARIEYEADKHKLELEQRQWELGQELARQRQITKNLEVEEVAKTEREQEFERLRLELEKKRIEHDRRMQDELRSLERERQAAEIEREQRLAKIQKQLQKERLNHDRQMRDMQQNQSKENDLKHNRQTRDHERSRLRERDSTDSSVASSSQAQNSSSRDSASTNGRSYDKRSASNSYGRRLDEGSSSGNSSRSSADSNESTSDSNKSYESSSDPSSPASSSRSSAVSSDNSEYRRAPKKPVRHSSVRSSKSSMSTKSSNTASAMSTRSSNQSRSTDGTGESEHGMRSSASSSVRSSESSRSTKSSKTESAMSSHSSELSAHKRNRTSGGSNRSSDDTSTRHSRQSLDSRSSSEHSSQEKASSSLHSSTISSEGGSARHSSSSSVQMSQDSRSTQSRDSVRRNVMKSGSGRSGRSSDSSSQRKARTSSLLSSKSKSTKSFDSKDSVRSSEHSRGSSRTQTSSLISSQSSSSRQSVQSLRSQGSSQSPKSLNSSDSSDDPSHIRSEGSLSTSRSAQSSDSSHHKSSQSSEIPPNVRRSKQASSSSHSAKSSPPGSIGSSSSSSKSSANHLRVASASQEQSADAVTQDEAVAEWNQKQKREPVVQVSQEAPMTSVIEYYHEKRPEVRLSRLKKSDGQKAVEAQIDWNRRQKEEMTMRPSAVARRHAGTNPMVDSNRRSDHVASTRGVSEKAGMAKDLWNKQQRRALMTKAELRLEDRKQMVIEEAEKVRAMLRVRRHPDALQESSIKIQAIWLARRYRKQFLARKRRVVFIQVWWRRRHWRKQRPVDFILQNFAQRQREVFFATKLQAAYRGFRARRRVSNMKYFKKLEHQTERDKEKLQRQKEKAVLRERLKALGMVQEEQRKAHHMKDPLDLELERRMNDKMHALQKGLAANEAELTNIEIKERQATVQNAIQRELDETIAAVVIQRRLRGLIGRRKAQKMRNAKHTEQVRAELAQREKAERRKQFEKQRRQIAAVKKIQALFRGMKARKLARSMKSERLKSELEEKRKEKDQFKKQHLKVTTKKCQGYEAEADDSIIFLPKEQDLQLRNPAKVERRSRHEVVTPTADYPLEERSAGQILEDLKQKQKQAKMQAVNDIRERLAEIEGTTTLKKRQLNQRELSRRHLAAARIQREWRMTLVRRRLEKTIAKKKDKDIILRKLHTFEARQSAKKEKAATAIQRVFRGRVGRLELDAKRSGATPSRKQILQEKSKLVDREKAALKIQSVFRGKVARDLQREAETERFFTDVNALNSEMATLMSRLRFRDRRAKAVDKAATSPNVELKALARVLPKDVLRKNDVRQAMSTLKSAMKETASTAPNRSELNPMRARSMKKSKFGVGGHRVAFEEEIPVGYPGKAYEPMASFVKPRSADAVMAALRAPPARTFQSDDARGVPPPRNKQVPSSAKVTGASGKVPRKVIMPSPSGSHAADVTDFEIY